MWWSALNGFDRHPQSQNCHLLVDKGDNYIPEIYKKCLYHFIHKDGMWPEEEEWGSPEIQLGNADEEEEWWSPEI